MIVWPVSKSDEGPGAIFIPFSRHSTITRLPEVVDKCRERISYLPIRLTGYPVRLRPGQTHRTDRQSRGRPWAEVKEKQYRSPCPLHNFCSISLCLSDIHFVETQSLREVPVVGTWLGSGSWTSTVFYQILGIQGGGRLSRKILSKKHSSTACYIIKQLPQLPNIRSTTYRTSGWRISDTRSS